MSISTGQLVRHIHDASARIVLAVSGGGSRAIADLLEVPGASRVVLEAVVPYAEASMIAWLGNRPDQFCSPPTARAMAVVAFGRARKYGGADESAAGIACTASLATDRPKRGAHRAQVALQTVARTVTWSLELQKEHRSRADEEELVRRMILNAVAEASDIPLRLDLPLTDEEQIEHVETLAPGSWQDLFLGKVEAVCERGGKLRPTGPKDLAPPKAVLSGAFNPLHAGHVRMAQVGQEILGVAVAMELSIVNVDKPPLDYGEIERRLQEVAPEQTVWLTRAATFEEKSRLFPNTTFLVGVDTFRRIVAPQYYPADPAACLRAVERIAARGCRFLVFGRDMGTGLVRLSDLELPDMLRDLATEVPIERFCEGISSTAIRKSGAW